MGDITSCYTNVSPCTVSCHGGAPSYATELPPRIIRADAWCVRSPDKPRQDRKALSAEFAAYQDFCLHWRFSLIALGHNRGGENLGFRRISGPLCEILKAKEDSTEFQLASAHTSPRCSRKRLAKYAPSGVVAKPFALMFAILPRCAPSPIASRNSTERSISSLPMPQSNAGNRSDWRDVIENNLNGTANTIRAFAPKMVAGRKGRFIVLSSMQGKHGTKGAASYSASKMGHSGAHEVRRR